MAKKGQTFRKYSNEFKEKVLKAYLSGQYSETTLAKEFDVNIKTLTNWISKMHNTSLEEACSNKKKGRPSNDIDYKERYEILKKYQAFLKAQQERK